MGDIRYSIWITDKADKNRRTRIGAAFEGNFGQLNLVLGPGVIIDRHVIENSYISLKPWKADDQAPRHKPAQDAPLKPGADDDDIPF